MTFEEIIDHLDELEKFDVESPDNRKALREAIAKLRDYQAFQSSDTSARLAAIKDIPTERVIALAQAEAAGLVSISASSAEGADAQPNEPLTMEELRDLHGKPVWLHRPEDGQSWWSVVRISDTRFYTDYGAWFDLRDYGETWVAYRRPPKEAKHE